MRVVTPKLFRLREDMPLEDRQAAARAGLQRGVIYWLHGTRPSSLGGYLGHYQEAKPYFANRTDWLYAAGREFHNIPTRYLEEDK